MVFVFFDVVGKVGIIYDFDIVYTLFLENELVEKDCFSKQLLYIWGEMN